MSGIIKTSVLTSSQTASISGGRIPDSDAVILTLACIGDSSNGSFPNASVSLTGSSGEGINAYDLLGWFLYQVGRTPGNPAPTNNYSVTITDARGFALDLGLLASNGSASAGQLTTIVDRLRELPDRAILAYRGDLREQCQLGFHHRGPHFQGEKVGQKT